MGEAANIYDWNYRKNKILKKKKKNKILQKIISHCKFMDFILSEISHWDLTWND